MSALSGERVTRTRHNATSATVHGRGRGGVRGLLRDLLGRLARFATKKPATSPQGARRRPGRQPRTPCPCTAGPRTPKETDHD